MRLPRLALLFLATVAAAACDAATVEANALAAGKARPLAGAATIRLPALTGRVVDEANLIPPDRERALSARLEDLERRAGPRFVVATVSTLDGASIEQFGLALGRHWRIGDARRNDGVLLIVAPNEGRVRIEVSRGLEPILTNSLCAQIIERDILPEFRTGNMIGGIEAGSAAIIVRLRASPTIGQSG